VPRQPTNAKSTLFLSHGRQCLIGSDVSGACTFLQALERAIRLLDRTPLTFTHKFGILYIAPDQVPKMFSRVHRRVAPGTEPVCRQPQRSEAEFLKNAGGSALYESFVRKLGHYMRLSDCG
jgi:hypothetical protein